MCQRRQLRVLIAGRQDEYLERALATHVRRLGYEVMVLTSQMKQENSQGREIGGDILLYDLDGTPFESEGIQRTPLNVEVGGVDIPLSALAPLTIVISSNSISRLMLERMGAVAHVHKPFTMERLQRYLQVLSRLLDPERKQTPQRTGSIDAPEVLIVDDDTTITRALRQRVQEMSGRKVAVVHDGLAALEYCLEWQPRCVVTDLILPWMNGYQVMHCLSLDTVPARPAFVIMSALQRREQSTLPPAYLSSAVTYLEKPFKIEHLLTAIERAVG